MEVIPSRSGGSGSIPFQRHNVEEWSRLDSLTGMLEHARVETDHWAANSSKGSRTYGKVVDSRARNLADGSVQQRQRKQLEVFQAQVPGGSLQVIRTQSVTSTSTSSSSWRTAPKDTNVSSDFENLQLDLNRLDFTSQKTKASIGRSGSIGGRRPPSRPRSLIQKASSAIFEEDTQKTGTQNVNQRLSEVSRICQKVHEEAKKNASNSIKSAETSSFRNFSSLGDDDMVIKVDELNRKDSSNCSENLKSIERKTFDSYDIGNTKKTEENFSNGFIHTVLTRKKSCSTEDLQNNDQDNRKLSEGNEMLADWKRTSKVRRSLQFPSKGNNLDFIPNGNVSKICKDLENGKKSDTIKNVAPNFEALENIFRHGTDSSRKSSMLKEQNRQTTSISSLTEKPGEDSDHEGFSRQTDVNKSAPQKRHSFVTVESLKEVRGRLRHLSNPPSDSIHFPNYRQNKARDVEETDDGIVTEDSSSVATPEMNHSSKEGGQVSQMKSYMYGMQAAAAKNQSSVCKSTSGTGSLESRTSNRSSSNSGSRSEEWYNRRKSYGFEQVHSQRNGIQSESLTFQDKSRVESSTDSGICRSSEAVTSLPWTQLSFMPNRTKGNDHTSNSNILLNHNIQIKSNIEKDLESRNITTSNKGRKTIVTLGCDTESNNHNVSDTSSTATTNGWGSGFDKTYNTHLIPKNLRRLSEPVTVTIPIVSDDSFKSTDTNNSKYFRQLPERTNVENGWDKSGNSLSDERKTFAARRELLLKNSSTQEPGSCSVSSGNNTWSRPNKQTNNEVKRHSIAVDEYKYVREGLKDYSFNDRRHINFDSEFNKHSTDFQDDKKYALLGISGINEAHKKEVLTSQDDNETKRLSGTFEEDEGDESLQSNLMGKKPKKVEFCKTEVHFAAEPGRFNIVETDEKPPPNNMFRRRRRNSAGNINLTTNQAQEINKSSLPEIRFGDSLYEKKLLGGTESKTSTYETDMKTGKKAGISNKSYYDQMQPTVPKSTSPINFQDDAYKEEDNIYAQANATILSPIRKEFVEVEDEEEEIDKSYTFPQQTSLTSSSSFNLQPRSILKNNRKPRPFHLGNMDEDTFGSNSIESFNTNPETKWGVKLRPVQSKESSPNSGAMWRSTVTLQNKTYDNLDQQKISSSTIEQKGNRMSQSFDEDTELQKLLKTLRPALHKKTANEDLVLPYDTKSHSPGPINSCVEVKISTTPTEPPTWSVAERVRQVEDLRHASTENKGYSTRVNFGAGETTVVENDQPIMEKNSKPVSIKYQPNSRPKPIWLRREESKQEKINSSNFTVGSTIKKPEDNKESTYQQAVATAKVQSYGDSSRLRAVETLVSTHSGHPKITSISLRYEDDASPREYNRNIEHRVKNPTTYHSNFRSLSPTMGTLHTAESVLPNLHPASLGINIPSIGTPIKSGSKSQITHQQGKQSFKSDKTYNQTGLSATISGSSPKTEHKNNESTYENLIFSPTRKASEFSNSNQNVLERRINESKAKGVSKFSDSNFELSLKSKDDHKSGQIFPSDCKPQSRRSLSPTYKEQRNLSLASLSKQSSSSSLESSVTKRNSSELKKEEKSSEKETGKRNYLNVKSSLNEKYRKFGNSDKVDKISENEGGTKTDKQSNTEKTVSKSTNISSVLSKQEKTQYSQEKSITKNKVDLTDRSETKSPVYENTKALSLEPILKSNANSKSDPMETDSSSILEELTRAADQILQAVNGYTDEESYRASSDDDYDKGNLSSGRRRKGKRYGQVRRPSANLGTITEAPVSKKQESGNSTAELHSHKTNGIGKKSQRLPKTRLGPTSSTSSVESFTKEMCRNSTAQSRSVLRHTSSSNNSESSKNKTMSSSNCSTSAKPGSRTARLLQRASSRELLLQSYASSSEDVASGVEGGGNRKPLAPRRSRAHSNNVNKTDQAKTHAKKDSQLPLSAKPRSRKKDVDVTKPKERYSGSTSKVGPSTKRSSGGESGDRCKPRTSRSREEDGHLRGSSHLTSRKDNLDVRHRSQREGMSTAEPNGLDKHERSTVYERQMMGSGVGASWSSTSCVVMKKKPSLTSSHNKGSLQTKTTK